ncbi:hypothetical protein T4D_3528, partial [Trichinella pseudospiralis]
MLGRWLNWKPCSTSSSGSGFQPLKFRFGMFVVWLCEPTTIWTIGRTGKTVTVLWQMDEGYTRGSGSVRRSAAYGVQPRRVVALTGRLRRSKI